MTVSAPPSVANRLRLNPGEPVVFIERLRYLGDLPLSLDLTYLAPDIGRDVIEPRWRTTTSSRSSSRSPVGGSATPASPSRRSPPTRTPPPSCRCPTSAAVLLLERLTHLDDGRPVDLEYIRMRGDRITLRGNLVRGD